MSRCFESYKAWASAACNSDLSMAEALNDPLIRSVMDADGVDVGQLQAEFERIAESREAALQT